jgi:hypothetical protein
MVSLGQRDFSLKVNLGPSWNRPETVGALTRRRFEDEFGGHRDRRL